MGARHEARRLALQALYALDANPELTPADALEHAWGEAPETGADRGYLEAVVLGVCAHLPELDRVIERVSRRWKIGRMDRVDRSILRLTAHELLHDVEVPAPVALDEGVELAKEFGTPDSPSFVNGILDRIAREHREGELAGREG